MRGEVDLPPTSVARGSWGDLLENADAYEARVAGDGGEAMGRGRDQPEKARVCRPGNALTDLNLGTALYMQRDADGALAEYPAPRPPVPVAGQGAFRHRRDSRDPQSGPRGHRGVHGGGDQRCRLPRGACFSLAQALRRNGPSRTVACRTDEDQVYKPARRPRRRPSDWRWARASRPLPGGRLRLEQAARVFPIKPGFAHRARTSAGGGAGRSDRDGARANPSWRSC